MKIDKNKSQSTEAAELRRQAEERLLAKKAEFHPGSVNINLCLSDRRNTQ